MPVNCMARIARAVAKHPASQACSLNLSGPLAKNTLVTTIPVNAAMKCPPRTARGWAKGESITP